MQQKKILRVWLKANMCACGKGKSYWNIPLNPKGPPHMPLPHTNVTCHESWPSWHGIGCWDIWLLRVSSSSAKIMNRLPILEIWTCAAPSQTPLLSGSRMVVVTSSRKVGSIASQQPFYPIQPPRTFHPRHLLWHHWLSLPPHPTPTLGGNCFWGRKIAVDFSLIHSFMRTYVHTLHSCNGICENSMELPHLRCARCWGHKEEQNQMRTVQEPSRKPRIIQMNANLELCRETQVKWVWWRTWHGEVRRTSLSRDSKDLATLNYTTLRYVSSDCLSFSMSVLLIAASLAGQRIGTQYVKIYQPNILPC